MVLNGADIMSDWHAIGLLILALTLLLLSTRQLLLSLRILIWLAGAAALAGAIWIALSTASYQRFLEVAGGGDVRNALLSNVAIVEQAITPLLAAFLALAVVLAALALLALTPGETVERFARPLITLLVGFIGGSLVALSAVALGFGGYLKPRSYVFAGAQVVPVDGDTFRVGDVSFRLMGIDAPESDQLCVLGSAFQSCGELASRHLLALFQRGVTVCTRSDSDRDDVDDWQPPRESFGRPVVMCTITPQGGAPFDLSSEMIRSGWATSYRSTLYEEQQQSAAHGGLGLWAFCTVSPDVWRNDPAAREAFRAQSGPSQGETRLIGCR